MKITNEQTKLFTPPHQELCQDVTDKSTTNEFCSHSSINIAVLIPRYNEVLAIYAYDNNSLDHTISIARSAGAVGLNKARQGKSNVIHSMCCDIEANCYITSEHNFGSAMSQDCYEVTSNGGGLTK